MLFNIILIALLLATMFTVGILAGIIINQRGTKEYNGEIINNICDDIIELQAVTDTRYYNSKGEQVSPEQLVEEIMAKMDQKLEEVEFTFTEIVSSTMDDQDKKIKCLEEVIKEAAKITKHKDDTEAEKMKLIYRDELIYPLCSNEDVEVKQQSRFNIYADRDRILSAAVFKGIDGKYFVAASDGWSFVIEKGGFINCTCKGNYMHSSTTKFETSGAANHFCKEILAIAKSEGII